MGLVLCWFRLISCWCGCFVGCVFGFSLLCGNIVYLGVCVGWCRLLWYFSGGWCGRWVGCCYLVYVYCCSC